MPTTNTMLNCVKCQKKTLHIEQTINHILHLLLSVFTAGFWIIAWIIIAITHDKKTQCTNCGHNKGFISDAISSSSNTEDGSSAKMVIFALIILAIIIFILYQMD